MYLLDSTRNDLQASTVFDTIASYKEATAEKRIFFISSWHLGSSLQILLMRSTEACMQEDLINSFQRSFCLLFRVSQSSTMPSGTNSQGNNYNTPGGTNSNGGSSYHCKYCSCSPRMNDFVWLWLDWLLFVVAIAWRVLVIFGCRFAWRPIHSFISFLFLLLILSQTRTTTGATITQMTTVPPITTVATEVPLTRHPANKKNQQLWIVALDWENGRNHLGRQWCPTVSLLWLYTAAATVLTRHFAKDRLKFCFKV